MTGTRSRIARCRGLTSQSMRTDGIARRSAAATGIACTMSPSAPSFTIRTRFTPAVSFTQEPRDQIARRVRLGVADNRDPPAISTHDRPLGHGVDRVIGALAMHVGLEECEQPLHVGIGKESHVIDAAKSRHEFGTI